MFRVLLVTTLCLTAGLARAAEPIKLFNGTDLSGWKFKGDKTKNKWRIGEAVLDSANPAKIVLSPIAQTPAMVNVQTGIDIYSEQKFGDCCIEIEIMVPKGSNSGIYVMGEYEVQILDSFGKAKVGPGDLGGIYATAAPRVNASKAPGEWQTMVIDFEAPRFENGKKTHNAKFVKVVLNGQVIHENVEVKGPTPACLTGKESPTGPIMFQGDHGPVALRNIKVTPK
jgi:hypothetical protein